MLLSDKKIFITAAGQGIGRAITEKFIKEKVDETIKMGTDAGYDLDHLRPMLDAIRSSSS